MKKTFVLFLLTAAGRVALCLSQNSEKVRADEYKKARHENLQKHKHELGKT